MRSRRYVCLPGASAATFTMFPCDTLDDGSKWLKADYTISCLANNYVHKGYIASASVMLCLYPIGIPLCYSMLLGSKRKRLNPPRPGEGGKGGGKLSSAEVMEITVRDP